MPMLRDLDLRGNPCEKLPKLRDFIISRGLSLAQIDGKEVTQRERTFIARLAQKKEKEKEKPAPPSATAAAAAAMKENAHINEAPQPPTRPGVMPAMGAFQKVGDARKQGLPPSYKRVVKKKEVLSSNGLSILGNTKPIYVPIPEYGGGPPSATSSEQAAYGAPGLHPPYPLVKHAPEAEDDGSYLLEDERERGRERGAAG